MSLKYPNTIVIAGEITSELYGEFSSKLRAYEKKKYKEVNIEISSGGGDPYSALAFYDRIKTTRLVTNITATGLVASAATLIFIACTRRFMTQNSWLMVHEDTISGIDYLKVSQVEKEAAHARRLEDQWVKLFFQSTAISKDYWTDVNKKETYFSSVDCLNLGIIEGLV